MRIKYLKRSRNFRKCPWLHYREQYALCKTAISACTYFVYTCVDPGYINPKTLLNSANALSNASAIYKYLSVDNDTDDFAVFLHGLQVLLNLSFTGIIGPLLGSLCESLLLGAIPELCT